MRFTPCLECVRPRGLDAAYCSVFTCILQVLGEKESLCYNCAVVTRGYGQYCGFARFLEYVGERWALLIIRDLLVGPKRFSDLQRGLAHIPSNILTTRLKELEAAGIVKRTVRPRPEGGVVYELTPDGRDLEESVVVMSRWGAKRLGILREGEIVTETSMAMALRSTFRPEHAIEGENVGFEVRVGDIVFHANVRGDAVEAGTGPLPKPDLLIEGGTEIRALMAGEISPKAALASGAIRIRGKRALLDRFAALFRI
jgi:DNA-binding HxlR family transcriptional regulator